MSDWTAGYVTEIGYTHGYYRDLSPSMMELVALSQAVRTSQARPLRYLELGFGQGLSLNIHAAACPGEYWGTDFNPVHAANARELALASGSGARIFDLSFEELAARDDLPEFDVIAMHGIWSWVNEANRHVLVDLLRRKLAVGGRLFISYNAFPGWSQVIPLRHLLTLHTELGSAADRSIGQKIDAAIDFAKRMVEAGGVFFERNPGAKDRVEKMAGEDRHYLAHEYFNRDWAPMPFSEVAGRLEAAKLTFAASAFLQDHVDVLNLSGAGQELVGGISHAVLRESVRDFLVNRRFRKDIFVKGPQAMGVQEQGERLGAQAFVLAAAPAQLARRAVGAIAAIDLPAEVVDPLLAVMAEDEYRPKTYREILGHRALAGQAELLLRQVLLLLVATGGIDPAQPEAVVAAARPACRALNAHIMNRARLGAELGYLASPVTGGGIPLSRYEQLFLSAHERGHRTPEAMATDAWSVLGPQGVVFRRDGQLLTDAQENQAELAGAVRGFVEHLPRLRALGIAS